jgi:hypothetical protein
MELQRLSEACFSSPLDLSIRHGDDLAGELTRRCLAALAEATGASSARWQPCGAVFHRAPNAATAVGAATATGWVERLDDEGSVVFRVVAASSAGVERVDASIAFQTVAVAAWCVRFVAEPSGVAAAAASARAPVPARRVAAHAASARERSAPATAR